MKTEKDLPMKNTSTTVRDRLIEGYLDKFPGEAAMLLNTFSVERILEYLKWLPVETVKAVLARLDPDTATEVLENMEEDLFTRIFSGIDTHSGARILSRLDNRGKEQKLALLPSLKGRELKEFMSYNPDTAGYFMETAVNIFYGENTVGDVLERIRKTKERRITAIYVTEESGILIGRISLEKIAISLPKENLKDLMQPPMALTTFASVDEVLGLMERENLLQIPITDVNNRLLGVIRNDALINATKQESTIDMQAMFGAGREEHALSKISFAVRKRLPWLQINLATAFLASLVVGFFEDTIARITILAVFLPVVAGQSGNTGSQALAVIIRGLALREISISQWFKVARKEIMVGLINGVVVAITTGTIVYFWSASFGIAVVIAISMVVSMMIAGFSGAVIPVALKAIGQDPATSSSIILTTVTDICGFLSFLGLATALASVLGIT
ncbi:MAG: magnesium transporter [Saprospiraceae bacterium]|nr:magnesium transporter [Saprospiraceae bacterium]